MLMMVVVMSQKKGQALPCMRKDVYTACDETSRVAR